MIFGIIVFIKFIKDGWKNNYYEWFEKYIDVCIIVDIFIFGVIFKLIYIKLIIIIVLEYIIMKCFYKVYSWCKFYCGF